MKNINQTEFFSARRFATIAKNQPEILNLCLNKRVKHRKFGSGSIIEVKQKEKVFFRLHFIKPIDQKIYVDFYEEIFENKLIEAIEFTLSEKRKIIIAEKTRVQPEPDWKSKIKENQKRNSQKQYGQKITKPSPLREKVTNPDFRKDPKPQEKPARKKEKIQLVLVNGTLDQVQCPFCNAHPKDTNILKHIQKVHAEQEVMEGDLWFPRRKFKKKDTTQKSGQLKKSRPRKAILDQGSTGSHHRISRKRGNVINRPSG